MFRKKADGNMKGSPREKSERERDILSSGRGLLLKNSEERKDKRRG